MEWVKEWPSLCILLALKLYSGTWITDLLSREYKGESCSKRIIKKNIWKSRRYNLALHFFFQNNLARKVVWKVEPIAAWSLSKKTTLLVILAIPFPCCSRYVVMLLQELWELTRVSNFSSGILVSTLLVGFPILALVYCKIHCSWGFQF